MKPGDLVEVGDFRFGRQEQFGRGLVGIGILIGTVVYRDAFVGSWCCWRVLLNGTEAIHHESFIRPLETKNEAG